MSKHVLHITNGDYLTERLHQLQLIDGECLVWREMLCEGPTLIHTESLESLNSRKKFLHKYYRITPKDYEQKFVSQLSKLDTKTSYQEIILWFEYDLFCHINMIAAISLLLRKGFGDTPIYLVCSGRIAGESNYFALTDLSDKQLISHLKSKKKLSLDDLELASHIWTLYCEENPKKLKGQITVASSFDYLSICIKAHLERFPNSKTGLNSLEMNILKMVNTYQIKNMKQLMGYALEYQGFYGYGDMQMKRIIAKLFQFLDQKEEQLIVSERGHLALLEKKNFYNTTASDWYYGGVNKYHYLYNNDTHNLMKL
ncbi:DUF1835 domain-containing protein [Aquimarina sp. W85]|uniref:DUF1835 domain-containing protein n=1 Tax=Aquimarina rhodophyticola TaxID=3342246 RepID=UPI00366E4AA0